MVKESSIKTWTTRAKLLIGTGYSAKEISQLPLKQVKEVIGRPSLSDNTIEGYVRNFNKLNPDSKGFSKTDADLIKNGVKDSWIKDGYSPEAFENLWNDIIGVKDTAEPEDKEKRELDESRDKSQETERTDDRTSDRRVDYPRLRNWAIDNDFDPDLIYSLDYEDLVEYLRSEGCLL